MARPSLAQEELASGAIPGFNRGCLIVRRRNQFHKRVCGLPVSLLENLAAMEFEIDPLGIEEGATVPPLPQVQAQALDHIDG